MELIKDSHHCNMRFISLIFTALLLFVVHSAFSQNPYLARLSIRGRIGELGISPKGDIWVATSAGKVYYRSQADQLWRESIISSKYDEISNHFERINFLADSIIILSGFLQADGKEDFVLRSENYGKTWEKVRFGVSSWLDGAYFRIDGTGWMTGNSQYIYYTKDSGKTWQTFDKIENEGNLRLISICFEKNGETGLFGSLWNSLYLTTDNCKSWSKLPTPLTQKKYIRISETNPPEIAKIRMLDNYYIIRQEQRTFISKKDHIEWQYHPEILDFEVTNAGNLYTIHKDRSFHLYNSNIASIWASDQKVDLTVTTMTVQGEKLFALTPEQLYQISPGNFKRYDLLNSDSGISKPNRQLQIKGEDYGFAGKDILKYDTARKQWFRYMHLDFSFTNIATIDGKLMISDQSYNQFYELKLPQKVCIPVQLTSKIFDLKANPVVEFHLERSTHGCYYQSDSIQSFIRHGQQFIKSKKTSQKSSLGGFNEAFDASIIDSLAGMLADYKIKVITIQELHINDNDIAHFKTFIDQQEKQIRKEGLKENRYTETVYIFPGENTDFDYYKKAADSLYALPPELINAVFSQSDSYWSTTTDTRRIVLVLKDGKKLVLENSYNCPNYLFVPWDIDYGQFKRRSNSIQLAQVINHLTKSSFFVQDVNDKNYAIFRIIDYSYRQKISQ
jgi:hypothetical protein